MNAQEIIEQMKYRYRAVERFWTSLDGETVVSLIIGTHDIYKG